MKKDNYKGILIETFEEETKEEVAIYDDGTQRYVSANFVNHIIDILWDTQKNLNKSLALLEWDKTAKRVMKKNGKD